MQHQNLSFVSNPSLRHCFALSLTTTQIFTMDFWVLPQPPTTLPNLGSPLNIVSFKYKFLVVARICWRFQSQPTCSAITYYSESLKLSHHEKRKARSHIYKTQIVTYVLLCFILCIHLSRILFHHPTKPICFFSNCFLYAKLTLMLYVLP